MGYQRRVHGECGSERRLVAYESPIQ